MARLKVRRTAWPEMGEGGLVRLLMETPMAHQGSSMGGFGALLLGRLLFEELLLEGLFWCAWLVHGICWTDFLPGRMSFLPG